VLEVVDHDPARDARRFDPVVIALEELTPRVEILQPGWCSFPTLGPSRFFGGDNSLADLAVEAAAAAVGGALAYESTPISLVPRVGVADGLFAASLAAQRERPGYAEVIPVGASREFLSHFSISALSEGSSPLAGASELVDVFWRLGLRTLADVAGLGAEDLLARFGVPGVLAHRLACGLDDRPPDTRPVPADLALEVDIDPPADRVDTVAFVAKAMADQIDERLARDGLVCVRLVIEAVSENGEVRSRVWRHEHRFTPGAMTDRVRWQLDGWFNSAQRPTGGVVSIRLEPDEVVPDEGRQLGFWGGQSHNDERAARALARVQGLLGPDAVTVPERGRGRRPSDVERRVSLTSVSLSSDRQLTAPEVAAAPWPGRLPAPAPAVVYGERERIEVIDAAGNPVVVNGRGEVVSEPVHVVRSGRRRTVAAWAGPWPIEERWWDAAGRRRQARFQVVFDDDTAHLVVVEGGTWWLEASYD
jgi:protein ImuB